MARPTPGPQEGQPEAWGRSRPRQPAGPHLGQGSQVSRDAPGGPLSPFSPAVAAPRPPLPHVEQYEVVWPRRLPAPRARRALPSHLDLYPESVSYVLGAQEHTFTLHLRKNRDLVGSGYTETYRAANGSQVVEQVQRQDHCFYQGHVEGQQDSAASLSTCAGLRGFFRAGSTVHLIEPLEGGGEEVQHALYRAEHLLQKAGTCGVSNSSLEKALGPRVSAAFRPRNWPLARDTRYVELYVVVDSTEFQKLGSRAAVRSRVLEVVNHVDKLYQELDFRVFLVGLQIWNHRDEIHVSSNPDTTLENFLRWRVENLVGRHQHDNAQLITGVDFTGTTVGLAKVSAMCSRDSGAVNQDHSLGNPVGVASTMAHEMGHNLGMDHDDNIQGCYCPVPQEGGGCVMAASIGTEFPKMFSHCSRTDLEVFMEKPRTACLANAPDPDRLVGDPVCGNRFLERGEQCDCGPPQVTPAGELCRPTKDACDLEEYCDGQQPACPEDVFQENGTPCPGGYCYNGVCPSLTQRCQDLWGTGSRVAIETCYAYRLSPGCKGSSLPDFSRVNKCGILYCEGGQKPLERSSCAMTFPTGTCQALVLEGGAQYEPVPEGTRCGEDRICWKGLCQQLQVYRSRNCSAQCNNHGVCNHKDECHCHPGWAPPYCTELLPQRHTGSRDLLVGVLMFVLLLALALLVAMLLYRKGWIPSCRRSAAPTTAKGLSNPLFHEGQGVPAKGGAPGPTIHPCQPARPMASAATPKQPHFAPSATLGSPAFTVPVYTRPPPQQPRPAPPAAPLPELKPKQVVKTTLPPPVPPVKPGAGAANPGASQGGGPPKVALKPRVQRR
uniref:ADAM metallopeptidase domain 8 n=1 Tax=Canis lupus familiaris TaxID=9615 RepID=A0A8P0PFP7_CANLF